MKTNDLNRYKYSKRTDFSSYSKLCLNKQVGHYFFVIMFFLSQHSSQLILQQQADFLSLMYVKHDVDAANKQNSTKALDQSPLN